MSEPVEGLQDTKHICRLRLIGHMEAWGVNGESVLPIGRKTRAMLAVIALSAPRPVLRARLADLLWSRRHEEQARASLRQELHRLLEALQPLGAKILDVTRDHIVLRPGLVWIDVQKVLAATTADSSALTLLEGELLEEFDDVDPALDQWLATERHRLRDQARSVAEAVLGAQEEAQLAIPAAQRLLSIDRSHEGAWRALMHGYAARGERGKAIQAYEQCRGVLTDLLNAAPLPDTQRLAADIRAGNLPTAYHPATETTAPPVRPDGRVKLGALAPFAISSGPEEQQFSLGLAEEVTVALSRFTSMVVVSSSSLAQFGDRNEAALRAAFGLDFLLDGSIQRAGQRLRITLRLLDLRNASHVVWTYRSDQQIKDLLSLQDEVAAEVASQVETEVQRVEGRLAAQQSAGNRSAQGLMLTALPLMARLQSDDVTQAADLLKRAIQLEPDNGMAQAWMAWVLLLAVGQGWSGNPRQSTTEAVQHAERAVALDPGNARALTIAGHVRASAQHRLAEAMELHSRALLLNPNLAMAWGLSAVTHLYRGETAEAERNLEQFKRLSPSDPNSYFFDAFIGLTALMQRDSETAAALGRQATELSPTFADGLRHYLAALGHTGNVADAEPVLARILAVDPRFSVESFLATTPFEQAPERDHYAKGLRLAGVAEEPTLVLGRAADRGAATRRPSASSETRLSEHSTSR